MINHFGPVDQRKIACFASKRSRVQIPTGPFKNVSKSYYSTIKYITRRTKADLILLTQKVYWYENMNDERVKSSLHPDYIVFHEYSTEETWEIRG